MEKTSVIAGEARVNEKKEKVRDLLKDGANRKELANAIGMSDRLARYFVSEIAKEEPVITVEEVGYRLVNTDLVGSDAQAEFEIVMRNYNDLISRANEIVKRALVLQNAAKVLKEKIGE